MSDMKSDRLVALGVVCARCGQAAHARPEHCPEVAAVEYHESGAVRRVEYRERRELLVQSWPSYYVGDATAEVGPGVKRGVPAADPADAPTLLRRPGDPEGLPPWARVVSVELGFGGEPADAPHVAGGGG